MTNYLLRGIPDDLWKKAKKRAASEGHTLKWLILQWLKDYALGLDSA